MAATSKKKYWLAGLGGLVLLFVLMILFHWFMEKTSTNESCMSCHIHPQADASWKQSNHYNSKGGTMTDCAACHLPPKGTWQHLAAKARMGMKDVWSYLVNDSADIDWEQKKSLEHAVGIVYNKSCEECHVNLYPAGVSDDGVKAHLYYQENKDKLDLQCISCHLDAGHFIPNYKHGQVTGKMDTGGGKIYTAPAMVTEFKNFTEQVPGTSASIAMVAIPGGSFLMGSSDKEPFHAADEAPQHKVTVSNFFMGECEVTWNQYWAFYNETMSEGRVPPAVVYAHNQQPDVDAVTGPTPPYGNPDQGWGMGEQPAITMTHYAAETFCQWLSLKTGKKYRLPTEAEWEYAARGGTQSPYFFEGNPKKFSNKGFWNKWMGADTVGINRYVVYANNSGSRTHEASGVLPNPFGLRNMMGNVMEYCSDWYAEDAYSQVPDGAKDPKGPEKGKEYVVRGGNYADDASAVRCATRGHTQHDEWLRTDPQSPKSIWWYSDVKGVGFRVVCEVPDSLQVK